MEMIAERAPIPASRELVQLVVGAVAGYWDRQIAAANSIGEVRALREQRNKLIAYLS